MTFLKLGALELPRTYDYSATLVEYGTSARTASNRLVKDITGYKWQISASYDYFSEANRIALLEVLTSGTFEVEFYAPTGEQLTSTFAVAKLPVPQIFKFNGVVPALWHNVGFTIEEV